jgi:hypothetical protein
VNDAGFIVGVLLEGNLFTRSENLGRADPPCGYLLKRPNGKTLADLI